MPAMGSTRCQRVLMPLRLVIWMNSRGRFCSSIPKKAGPKMEEVLGGVAENGGRGVGGGQGPLDPTEVVDRAGGEVDGVVSRLVERRGADDVALGDEVETGAGKGREAGIM